MNDSYKLVLPGRIRYLKNYIGRTRILVVARGLEIVKAGLPPLHQILDIWDVGLRRGGGTIKLQLLRVRLG